DLVRRVVRDLLDVHAAFGRNYDRDARGLAVDQHREIELLLDRRAVLDVEPVDLLALRAGLRRDESCAEDAGRFLLDVLDRLDHLDAARLAAPAGMDLRLHHPHGAAKVRALPPPPGAARAARGLGAFTALEGGKAAGHGHAEFREAPFAWYSWM